MTVLWKAGRIPDGLDFNLILKFKFSYLILGALFQWRIALGLVCIPALLCLTILISIAPESPAWLMSKQKDKGQLIQN